MLDFKECDIKICNINDTFKYYLIFNNYNDKKIKNNILLDEFFH